MKTAIVIHLYYIDMLGDLCSRLDELSVHMDFDVFVTTQARYSDMDTMRNILHKLRPEDFEIVEDRGRDVRQTTFPRTTGPTCTTEHEPYWWFSP